MVHNDSFVGTLLAEYHILTHVGQGRVYNESVNFIKMPLFLLYMTYSR